MRRLEEYISNRVRIEGFVSGKDDKYSHRYVVAIEDVRVFTLDGEELEWQKDHAWIQEAWEIKKQEALKKGDWLTCIATAKSYKKKGDVTDICFIYPTNVEWQVRC